jgi:hypothetical protein
MEVKITVIFKTFNYALAYCKYEFLNNAASKHVVCLLH